MMNCYSDKFTCLVAGFTATIIRIARTEACFVTCCTFIGCPIHAGAAYGGAGFIRFSAINFLTTKLIAGYKYQFLLSAYKKVALGSTQPEKEESQLVIYSFQLICIFK